MKCFCRSDKCVLKLEIIILYKEILKIHVNDMFVKNTVFKATLDWSRILLNHRLKTNLLLTIFSYLYRTRCCCRSLYPK